MALNTSCSVMNSSFGPLRVALGPEMATAAGMTARPAIKATSVSENTIRAAFFTRFSFLLR